MHMQTCVRSRDCAKSLGVKFHCSIIVHGYHNCVLTVTETANPIHSWHLYDKGKHVVDECVEGLVGEHSPGQVGH